MTVAEFIAAFRLDLRDGEPDPLWSNAEIVSYLNAAVQEANERALLTEDRSMSVALVPGQSMYSLHPSVFRVKRAVLRGRPLDEMSFEELDGLHCGWEAWAGLPRAFVVEQASGVLPMRLRLVGIPSAADTLALTVYRGALKPLSVDRPTDKIELPERFHFGLKDWAYRCAYLKQDTETLDKTKAAEYELLFERAFGQRPDANVQRKQRDRRPPVVRMRW